MRQRLGIAAALLREPRLLLLDEPATGLDPAGMRDMRALIRHLAGEGMTVLLSSHLLAEVEELCNRVGDRAHGRIVYEGALAELGAGRAALPAAHHRRRARARGSPRAARASRTPRRGRGRRSPSRAERGRGRRRCRWR